MHCSAVGEVLQGQRGHGQALQLLQPHLPNHVLAPQPIQSDRTGEPQQHGHRHREQPTRRAGLADITCDCGGKVDRFIDLRDVKRTRELHTLRPDEPYYIGFFLVGAYQEILGDMHNLFGDTDSVNVVLDDKGDYTLNQAQQGDTVDDVLRYVNFNIDDLLQSYRDKIGKAELDDKQRSLYLEELEAGLRSRFEQLYSEKERQRRRRHFMDIQKVRLALAS